MNEKLEKYKALLESAAGVLQFCNEDIFEKDTEIHKQISRLLANIELELNEKFS